MRALGAELSGQYKVQVDVVALDLAERDAPQRLYERLQAAGRPIDVLINNAGVGIYGAFIDIDWERERAMLELDIISLVHMTKLFVRDMVARNTGYVLQIASIGAYQPSPTYATYSAAKSFVLYFGEALRYELRHTHVKVTVLSPGVTRTEFLDVAGQRPTLYQRTMMMDSPTVANIGIEALLKGKPSVVAGPGNNLLAFGTRFIPRQLSAAITARFMK